MTEEEAPGQIPLWEQYKLPFLFIAFGLLILIVGARIFFHYSSKPQISFSASNSSASAQISTVVTVDVSGAIEKPGLYTLPQGSRVQDALEQAGGLSTLADQEWIAKQLNLAQKLTDGSKLYIPKQGEVKSPQIPVITQISGDTNSIAIVNINSASEKDLESLPGIGEVTAAKIVTNRPYQSIDELLNKKVVGKATFEKIKELIAL